MCLSILAMTTVAACADTFEPIDPGAPPFSIFGYLDASADTQWIRVSALRTVLRASAAPTGVTVTLEDLASGRTIELRDSAMPYATALGGDSVYAHDFWTTERIVPGAAYRFRAAGDGAAGESVVRIPRDYHLEYWGQVRVEGVKEVAFLFWNTYYYDNCHISRVFRYIQHVDTGGDSGVWMIRGPGSRDYARVLPVCTAPGSFTITRQDVEVVASDTVWPSGDASSAPGLAPDPSVSNITGAIGFLGGVLTKWTRAEPCSLPGPSTPDNYCKLRYDSTTATLRGTVSSGCSIPPDSVAITLRELEAPPGELPRTRPAILDVAGHYDVGALRPGIPHQLTIAVGDTTGRFHPRLFRVVYDTLQFTAGRVTTHEATLEPIGPCLSF